MRALRHDEGVVAVILEGVIKEYLPLSYVTKLLNKGGLGLVPVGTR